MKISKVLWCILMSILMLLIGIPVFIIFTAFYVVLWIIFLIYINFEPNSSTWEEDYIFLKWYIVFKDKVGIWTKRWITWALSD
jgi:hypothetical protein